MRIWHHLKRPPWRTALLLFAVLGTLLLAYCAWSPGERVRDGRHDLRSNGIWLQHGWLGDDLWFEKYDKDKSLFRNDEKIGTLAALLSKHGIKYVFPHLCPCDSEGDIALVNPAQTERFLDRFEKFSVIPWIGGVNGLQCALDSPEWRKRFVASSVDLLQNHPRLAGVQVNIEPLTSGNSDFLVLLDELQQAMPPGKILSVAAYPPPTRWHPYPEVHWEERYIREVAQRTDQLAFMMYDAAIKLQKPYRYVMSAWTSDVLEWSEGTQVLLGIPAYDDPDVGYHFPQVENLENALFGIHASLKQHGTLPENYAGVAIYCGWEMDHEERDTLEKEFERGN